MHAEKKSPASRRHAETGLGMLSSDGHTEAITPDLFDKLVFGSVGASKSVVSAKDAAAPIKVRVGGATGLECVFAGRLAWALRALIRAGDAGVTPIDTPAPLWSGYVFKLREAGILVETINESHGGAFPGTHARYRLSAGAVVVIDGAVE